MTSGGRRRDCIFLGVTRTDRVMTFASHGVVSFDSTSPLRQAFKDDKDNYYTMDRTYTAIRVPQVEGNPSLQKRIRAGLVSQEQAGSWRASVWSRCGSTRTARWRWKTCSVY